MAASELVPVAVSDSERLSNVSRSGGGPPFVARECVRMGILNRALQVGATLVGSWTAGAEHDLSWSLDHAIDVLDQRT